LPDITEKLVEELLHVLDASKSPGADGLHPYVLQKTGKIIAIPLSIIFGNSMTTGKLPRE
jgi:hypothetical protein